MRPVEPWALLSEQGVSPWAPARAAPKEALEEAASESGEPQAAAVWARVAAEPRREAAQAASARQAAVPAAWAPGARQAAAEPQPEAAQAASERPAAAGAAEVPDGPQAAAEVGAPDGPQVEAEAVLPDAAVRLPAGARRADGVAQPRAVVPPGARVLQAEPLPAVPSAAASVFRQGPSLEAGPARPRAAKRPAHAMRCLPIASRSEPSSQAARNEGWSWC
ncbi:hypothetical protein [Bradyrhizobium liaoningense]